MADSDTEEEQYPDNDLPDIPENVDLDDIFTLPVCYFEPHVLQKLVINRRRKREPNFVWPLKRVDMTRGAEDRVYVPPEEQKREVSQKRDIIVSQKNKCKRIKKEISDEMEKIQMEVNRHVQSLFKRHIPQTAAGKPKLGKTHFAKARRNIC